MDAGGVSILSGILCLLAFCICIARACTASRRRWLSVITAVLCLLSAGANFYKGLTYQARREKRRIARDRESEEANALIDKLRKQSDDQIRAKLPFPHKEESPEL